MNIDLRNSVPTAVEAVLLFGSQSRGDATYGSDVDLAVFANVGSIDALAKTKHQISLAVEDPNVFWSVYSVRNA